VIIVECVIAVAAAAQDARPTMTVGTAVAKRGEMAYGELQVPKASDAALTMSVAVIHGVKPGKVVAFVAGSHGTEYTSIVALTRLITQINPKQLTGTVIVAPLLNVASFEQITPHVNPIDQKGMNGAYPGDKNGTQTDRALALVTDQIVTPADVIVDLHGGDLDENLRPYSYWTRTGNMEQDEASHALVLAFGLDHVILRDVDAANPASTRSLSGYALAKGKTALVAEAGRSGTVLDADVSALISGSLNVLGSLKMIDRPVKPLAKPVWVTGGSRVAADKGGMFFATVDRDTIVKEGATIGYTTDYVGRRTGDVRAPVEGLVTFIRGVPSMSRGATLANISPILTTVPPYKKP
jgi:predicted deacylase